MNNFFLRYLERKEGNFYESLFDVEDRLREYSEMEVSDCCEEGDGRDFARACCRDSAKDALDRFNVFGSLLYKILWKWTVSSSLISFDAHRDRGYRI